MWKSSSLAMANMANEEDTKATQQTVHECKQQDQ